MKTAPVVLSITGSDNTGTTGIQADIRTISALGGHALTAITAVTMLDGNDQQTIMDLPCEMILGQTRAIIDECHPCVCKVGMVREPETIRLLRNEIVGCRHRVMVPSIMTSDGKPLLSRSAINAWRTVMLPEATLLIMRCNEAEQILRHPIVTVDDMLAAAHTLTQVGAEAVMLRGNSSLEGRITSMFYTGGQARLFASTNTEGWMRHGVSGAMTSAIAARLALGDDIEQAIEQAHSYMHSQVVYTVEPSVQGHRTADLYNQLLSLIVAHHRKAHDVAFYADQLAVSTRYLSTITQKKVQKSPKQVIDEYLMREACTQLSSTLLTVSEIADRLGFSSLAAFSTFFSAHQEMSPVAYRNSLNRQ